MSALFRTPVAFTPAPSGRVINALLQHADVTEDLGGGRICLRLSAKRAKSAEVKAALGVDARRAAELAVIYDERQAEVVEIAPDQALAPEAQDAAEAAAWNERFEREFDRALMFWNSEAHARQRRSPKRYAVR